MVCLFVTISGFLLGLSIAAVVDYYCSSFKSINFYVSQVLFYHLLSFYYLLIDLYFSLHHPLTISYFALSSLKSYIPCCKWRIEGSERGGIFSTSFNMKRGTMVVFITSKTQFSHASFGYNFLILKKFIIQKDVTCFLERSNKISY